MLYIDDLKKTYPGFELEASLKVLPGRITGLVGENGSGKTTLFKAILGLIHTDGGQASLFGKPTEKLSAADRIRIGAVLADSGFSGYITLRDVSRILKGAYPTFREDWFQEQCIRYGLPENKRIREMSTGMKAKLKILAALSHGAEFLILDEPTAGLDVIVREDVLNMIREYMEEDEQRSVLISSHISSDLESLCDDFYMIHGGKIVFHEETDRLLSNYGVLKVRPAEYDELDKSYILKKKKEPFGYSLLTDQKDFYRENAPGLVMEQAGLDELILLMVKGESL